MFGKRKTKAKPQPIQGINGMIAPPAPVQMGAMDKVGILGGMISDTFGGSGNAARMTGMANSKLAQLQQQAQQSHQLSQIKQMIGGGQGAQGGPSAAGLSPQLMAAAQINPQAYAGALAKQQMGHHTVSPGASVATYGGPGQAPQLTQANQNFQHGNKIGTKGPNGFSVSDMGSSYADQNATLGHQVDVRGQNIDFDTAKMQDGTKRYEIGVDDANTDFANQTGRMNAQTGRDRLSFDQTQPGGGVKRSLNPVYGTDANGNAVIAQLTSTGQLAPAAMPEGFSPLGPEGKAFATTAGKARGEASVALPGAVQQADEAIRIINQIRTHPGLDAGTGKSSAIPAGVARYVDQLGGSDRVSFDALVAQGKGKAFLQARESLKGTGTLSDFESAQAQDAEVRMNQAQSKEDFLAAMTDWENSMTRALTVAKERAGGADTSSGLSAEEEAELAELERMFGG